MKHIIYFILFAIIFLILGFWPQLCSPKQFHFGYIQKGYECYQSTFNPHKIFEDWSIVHAELLSETFKVMLGNPKIKWLDDNEHKEYSIPEGELTASIICFFELNDDGLWILKMYGYKDKDGFNNIYMWDVTSECYKKVTSNS